MFVSAYLHYQIDYFNLTPFTIASSRACRKLLLLFRVGCQIPSGITETLIRDNFVKIAINLKCLYTAPSRTSIMDSKRYSDEFCRKRKESAVGS